MKAVFWHLLGWVLIVLGVSAILGDLLGFSRHGAVANWPLGAVVTALGAWAWMRGMRARRNRERRGSAA